MARLLTPDDKNDSTPLFPANGEAFTLEEMQEIVGGYIQHIHLPDGRVLVMNEDGKMLKLPYNFQASMYANEAGVAIKDYVVGNVILCSRKEAGYEADA